ASPRSKPGSVAGSGRWASSAASSAARFSTPSFMEIARSFRVAGKARMAGNRWETGQRPERNSLRLLPSGSDRVGEGLVRASLPRGLYQGKGRRMQDLEAESGFFQERLSGSAGCASLRHPDIQRDYPETPMALPENPNIFANNPLDRASYRRTDKNW